MAATALALVERGQLDLMIRPHGSCPTSNPASLMAARHGLVCGTSPLLSASDIPHSPRTIPIAADVSDGLDQSAPPQTKETCGNLRPAFSRRSTGCHAI